MEKVGHVLWLAVVNEEITEGKNIAPFYLYMQHNLQLPRIAPVHPEVFSALVKKWIKFTSLRQDSTHNTQ